MARDPDRRRPRRRHRDPRTAEPRGPHGTTGREPWRAALFSARAGNPSRLRTLDRTDPSAILDEIRRRDILVHLSYHSFDTSILRFIHSAAADPAVLAIKLTIYRTGHRSPIIQALKEAARRGKQLAVLVEITARFDEAHNISGAKELQQAGAHVAYGVERVKTHVKLVLVVREEPDGIRRYVRSRTLR